MQREDLLKRIQDAIINVTDFPKPGVTFKDLSPILANHELFSGAVEAIADRYRESNITHVVSCEAAGFVVGAAIALSLRSAFVTVRRPNRLPRHTISAEIVSGYHTERLEMHSDALSKDDRVLVVDDLIMTGSTLIAVCDLVRQSGATLVECACLSDISELDYRTIMQEVPLFVLIHSSHS